MSDKKNIVETKEAVETEEPRFVVSDIKTKHAPTERSNDEIQRIFNKRRPYCPNDFKRQTFIPNLRDIDKSR